MTNPETAGVEAVAYLKHWWADGDQPRCRVDLTEINEPWLDALNPTITPLYAHPPAPDHANCAVGETLKALVTAVTYADPPKLFNGVLCHEARVPVEFINEARAAIAAMPTPDAIRAERDTAIRARDDHFRNSQRLAARCVEAEDAVRAIRAETTARVVAEEREQCAVTAENYPLGRMIHLRSMCNNIAAAIRSRPSMSGGA
jgi:hypothetical protein